MLLASRVVEHNEREISCTEGYFRLATHCTFFCMSDSGVSKGKWDSFLFSVSADPVYGCGMPNSRFK